MGVRSLNGRCITIGDTVGLENFASNDVLEDDRAKGDGVSSRHCDGGTSWFGEARVEIVGVGTSSRCTEVVRVEYEEIMADIHCRHMKEKKSMGSGSTTILDSSGGGSTECPGTNLVALYYTS